MLLDIEVGITSGFTPMYMYAAMHSSSALQLHQFHRS